jgi:hypothetical protein
MENQWKPDKDEKLGIPYEEREDDRVPFECIKQYLRYPAKFRHGERTLIADLPKETSDGRDVKLFESRCAARFFTVAVLPDAEHPVLSTKADQAPKWLRWRRLPKPTMRICR